jgi:hypothetical protein
MPFTAYLEAPQASAPPPTAPAMPAPAIPGTETPTPGATLGRPRSLRAARRSAVVKRIRCLINPVGIGRVAGLAHLVARIAAGASSPSKASGRTLLCRSPSHSYNDCVQQIPASGDLVYPSRYAGITGLAFFHEIELPHRPLPLKRAIDKARMLNAPACLVHRCYGVIVE